MKKIATILLIFFIQTLVYPQKASVGIATQPVSIQYLNGREVFNVCKGAYNVSFKDDELYFWYNEYSKIKSTKGGSGGDLLHGKYQFFDEKGNLKREMNYYLGVPDGTEKVWDSVGKIAKTFKYNKGKLIYSKQTMEDSDELIEWNGPPNEKGSVKKIYTSYGRLEQTEEMLETYLRAKVTTFYSNSKVKERFTMNIIFKYMEEDYREYYENGNIKVNGRYEHNWRTGDWTFYNMNGSIIGVEKNRINRQYNPENKLMSEGGEYFNPKNNEWIRNGLWIWYKPDGQGLERTQEYEYGETVEKK